MHLEARWERGFSDRKCYYCGKEFTLNEVSKVRKESRQSSGQSPSPRRAVDLEKKTVPEVSPQVLNLRTNGHGLPNQNDEDDSKKCAPLSAEENLKKVLARLKKKKDG